MFGPAPKERDLFPVSVLSDVSLLKIGEIGAGRVGLDNPGIMEGFTGSAVGFFSGLIAAVSYIEFIEAPDDLAIVSSGEDDVTGPSVKAFASNSCTRQATLEDGFLVVEVAASTVSLGEMLALCMACS